MPDVGDTLDGYRLDAVVGRGGMGTVYRATDMALEKTVAVKVIAPHLADDETFVRRFHEEAKALARLDGPGVVDVYAMRETKAALFFVMEYVEGPSLEAVLQRRGALDPDQALSLLDQVLEAVGNAHASGILHRDLKPSNILLDEDGRAVITDFGLAKILTSDAQLTATHDRLGTVAYMSPEQIEGLQHVSEASDLFSVGLIAYEALTGRLPFDTSASDYVIQRAIVEESFLPPSTFAPDVPPSVEQVVLDLLAKDPSDRPPNAEAARDRLPDPDADPDRSLSVPPTSTGSSTGLSGPQWIGLGTLAVLLLAGAYVGVRAGLNLSPLSLAPPSPDSTVRTAATTAPAEGTEERSDSMDAETAPVQASLDTSEGSEAVVQDPTSSPSAQPSSSPPPPSDPPAISTDETSSEPSPDDPVDDGRGGEAQPDPVPSPPPPRGQVQFRSRPEGATVRLQDSLVGRTPLTIGDLAPDSYRIELRRENHQPLDTTVQIGVGDTIGIAPTLVPRLAVISLRAVPSGDLLVNGVARTENTSGTLTDSLPPGTHQLVVSSPLGRWETEVQLEAGERYERVVDFTERVEAAVIARTPSGTPLPNAIVRVDETEAGYTPQRLSLRVGQHTLRVEKEGYVPAERTVLFESDMDTPIVVELAPRSE